ncbi:hypothetical protein PIB30_056164 [Stylosanthes scabra]|uniref:Uncharacterized protein n=1 Tax=Stylosanthes scabra TaxID=79078 RepID=A0ABU6QIS5_9FABA|nr:hypothetical protein [Stylosanthes scabra]
MAQSSMHKCIAGKWSNPLSLSPSERQKIQQMNQTRHDALTENWGQEQLVQPRGPTGVPCGGAAVTESKQNGIFKPCERTVGSCGRTPLTEAPKFYVFVTRPTALPALADHSTQGVRSPIQPQQRRW